MTEPKIEGDMETVATREPKNPKPEIHFTTEEVKKLASYMNFVNSKAEFSLKAPDMQEFIKLTSSVIHLMKKCENHIFEITEHYKASK
jgi:hypothetical protein